MYIKNLSYTVIMSWMIEMHRVNLAKPLGENRDNNVGIFILSSSMKLNNFRALLPGIYLWPVNPWVDIGRKIGKIQYMEI